MGICRTRLKKLGLQENSFLGRHALNDADRIRSFH